MTLHNACRRGDLDEVKRLIQEGADINEGAPGISALHAAICNYHDAVAEYLIKAGAHPDTTNCFGYTPLHTACRQNQYSVVCLLLEAGADIHAKPRAGRTPLHSACCGTDERIIIELLKAGADAYCKDIDWHMPLYLGRVRSGTQRLMQRTQPLIVLVARADIPTDLIREFTLFL